MHAQPGDHLVVDGSRVGTPVRRGLILEVLDTGGTEHFRVRWEDDGHESVFYPSSDTHVEPSVS